MGGLPFRAAPPDFLPFCLCTVFRNAELSDLCASVRGAVLWENPKLNAAFSKGVGNAPTKSGFYFG